MSTPEGREGKRVGAESCQAAADNARVRMQAGGFSMTPEVTNKSKPRTSSQPPFWISLLLPLKMNPIWRLCSVSARDASKTGSGKQQMHDGGKRAL
jgi:hypothetical protein